ncbi:glycosyltransferase [Pseudomonas putida]|uniref:Glycosyltransferase n=1 Tax=Pseudomonas putida TaxID=303 RepID=A0A2Z4RRD4_PSEPU|nr:glycosyltransferase [Pseudomonas putida]
MQAFYDAAESSIDFEQLDARAQASLKSGRAERHWVRPTLFSRLASELRLRNRVKAGDVVLCFHGLVPLFPLKGQVTVFLQNRILLSSDSLKSYPLKTRVRLWGERFMLSSFSGRIDKFVVQTPSMAEQVRGFLGEETPVVVCPFMLADVDRAETHAEKIYDFVYVASAEPHKNHQKLLAAWCLLAEQGLRPSLVLTVPTDTPLSIQIEELKRAWGLNVFNLGQLSPGEVGALYDQSKALIYPSITESLGLPLIEANLRQLPIIAAELDYVRDIVEPAQTFDPASRTSIARAVKRHLESDEPIQVIHGPVVFLKEIMR